MHTYVSSVVLSLIFAIKASDEICTFGQNGKVFIEGANELWVYSRVVNSSIISINGEWEYYGLDSYHGNPYYVQEYQDLHMEMIRTRDEYWIRDNSNGYAWCSLNVSYPGNCANSWEIYSWNINSISINPYFIVQDCSYFTVK